MKLKQVLTIMVIIALVIYIAILHHRVDVAEKRFNYLNQNINILSEKIDTQNVKPTKVQFDNCAEGYIDTLTVEDKVEIMALIMTNCVMYHITDRTVSRTPKWELWVDMIDSLDKEKGD